MVDVICDSFEFDYSDDLKLQEENKRYMTLEYDTTKDNDNKIMQLINELLFNEQPRCERCKHYCAGYEAHRCDIYGGLIHGGYYENADECPTFIRQGE